MASTSVSAAKNRMARAVESILDPWPATSDPVWDFFASECAYCGIKLVRTERLGHIDHATAGEGNHLAISCSHALFATATRSSTRTGVSSLSGRSATWRFVRNASSGSSVGSCFTRSRSALRPLKLPPSMPSFGR